MKQFLVLYGATAKALEQWKEQSPEEGEKDMREWGEWMRKNAGHMVDAGNPVGGNTRLESDNSAQEHSNEVCGYTIIKAEDKKHAIEILSDSPHTKNSEMYIELMEIIDMEM